MAEDRSWRPPGTSATPDSFGFESLVLHGIERARGARRYCIVALVSLNGVDELAAAAGSDVGRQVTWRCMSRLRDLLDPDDAVVELAPGLIGLVATVADMSHLRRSTRAMEQALARSLMVEGLGTVQVPASIGVKVADHHGDAGRSVYDANVALHEAERRRPHQQTTVVFDEMLRANVRAQFKERQQIIRAFRAEEFVLHYQPLVQLRGGQVTGCEALLRWPDDHERLPGPTTIVPVLEETGLVSALGAMVRTKALRDVATALRRSPGLLLSVNMSPLELAQSGLAEDVERVCGAAAVNPRQLCLELTETALVAVQGEFSRYEQLVRLRRLGVKLAIDDFGTGFSALNYLKSLPVDIVKIDRSFVIGVDRHPADRVLVDSVTRVAHALGLTVVAEGVETESQRATLAAIGVDQAQGYLFGRPAQPEEFLALAGVAG
ncbi:MAG TPA: EAL domain-containing protein [Acidimicrobiales bacterium]|nr:EAL domain-containing protein [Acidimicrobiales bacterium]